MKRALIIAALLALVVGQSAVAQSTLRRVYDDLSVDVWTDRDDGSSYQEGDNITIYFRASRDCYVTIYDLDTRGNIDLIFPEQPDQNNFVVGDEIYMIPDRSADFEFEVTGPPGTEYIQMVASTEPYQVPEWWDAISVVDEGWPFSYEDDDEQFLDQINQTFFPSGSSAYDQVSFYVAPKYYYKRAEVDCSGDCGVVYVDYPTGCDVYIDGVYWGASPLWIPSIYLGRHRVSVYWGTVIVYNDWIDVFQYRPYYVYTRPHYLYPYYYRHWNRPYRWGETFGPSRIKYKPHTYYTGGRPDQRPGYTIVDNDRVRYNKSKVYSTEKVKRISSYKQKYGYDHLTKTYTTTKTKPTGTYTTKGRTKQVPVSGKGYEGKGKNETGRSKSRVLEKKNTTATTPKSGIKVKPKSSSGDKGTVQKKSTTKTSNYKTWKKTVGTKSTKTTKSTNSTVKTKRQKSTTKSKAVSNSKSSSKSGSKSVSKSTSTRKKSSSSSSGVKKSGGSSKRSSSSAVKSSGRSRSSGSSHSSGKAKAGSSGGRKKK
jgi:hypothetical protein